MKKLTTTILACGLLASGLIQTNAATMRLSADGGTTWTVIDDNSPLDTDPTPGFISYSGPVGGWVISITSGLSSPIIGSPIAPVMDVSSVNSSAGPASLIVQMSETNCIPANNQTFIGALIGQTAGTIQYNSYRDTGNVLFGSTSTYPGDAASPSATASPLMTFGPVSGNGLAFSNGVVVPVGGLGLYSLTIQTILIHSGPGFSSTDASLITQTPPCSCTVSFLSPPTLSLCPGDPIPDVTASEDCGNGPTPLAVTPAGAVTNGICPQVITRTNTAMDDCGNVSTFVQTITINCKPDCTLKGSVLSAIVGTGGLNASVADAGAGANYFWTITNGSITNGQGTAAIGFVAGLDPSQPVGISVTISTAAGCVTTCSLSIPVIPRCDCTITFTSPQYLTNCAGDTIPAVVAYQKCASSASSNLVTVTCIGAKTNGTCPKIITRTNAAVSTCGDRFTFVQTITVNCRGTICGHIFADCDGDGDLTQGDVGLSKVIVSLLLNNTVVCSIMTDSNGGYCFTNLAGGCYVVAVTSPSGYSQTAASTSYHWRDSYGRDCWNENDGNIHCVSSGTECWWDKSNTCHWKDGYGRDCWKDNWGGSHCQPCSYQSCNAPTNNNKISVCLGNCQSQSDVDFAFTGTKSSLSVCVTGPSYVKCGQTYTYTCTVTNTGNVCFTGGTVCHTIGNCNYGNWNYGCNTFNTTCPPLSPGQHCTITQKCSFNSWNCGTVTCQSTVNCKPKSGYGSNCSGQSSCYSQCGW